MSEDLPDRRDEGRPTLTDDLIDDVAKMVQLGVPVQTAAAAKGIVPAVHLEWMMDGEQGGTGKGRQRKYYLAVVKAMALFEVQVLGKIRSAANENWQASAWLLERRLPEKYLKKSVNAESLPPQPGQNNSDPFSDLDDNVTPIRRPRRSGA